MIKILRFFKRVLYWTYSRGSWQWDLMCLFIIAVIFTTPKDFLHQYTRRPLNPAQIRQILHISLTTGNAK
jgi:hypothetical protein